MTCFAKRSTDFVIASAALLILAPLVAIIALAIWLAMGRPVLFRQVRSGYKGKPFRLIKFRTMTNAHDAQGRILSDFERLTALGKFLRRLSLDEVPQLWNVCRGEMSLVGPRPLLVEYLDRYTPEQARRHEVKPGLTGWAQVNGRNTLTWKQKFELDLWYIDHWSLRLDARILLQTVLRVLKCEGISRQNHATMPKFLGSEQDKT